MICSHGRFANPFNFCCASQQHEFISRFKVFLARHARDADDFAALRRQQRHFMVIFTFE